MIMALTAAQMNDSAYLANMINKLAAQKTNALRDNEMTTQQNMRRLREANALNGINGGFEESNYARLLAGQNAARATIGDTYDPQIAEYQILLDQLRALQAASSGSGGGGSGKDKKPYYTPNPTLIPVTAGNKKNGYTDLYHLQRTVNHGATQQGRLRI